MQFRCQFLATIWWIHQNVNQSIPPHSPRQNVVREVSQGWIQGWGGGGVLGVRTTPLWGTPKLHKEGKNVARVRAKKPRFST